MRKEEADPNCPEKLPALGGILINVDAQRLQTVGCAAGGRCGAVAVLCDLYSARGKNEGCSGGYAARRKF